MILRSTTESIARKLNALVAPIIPFVPEGDIKLPSLQRKYSGTISVTAETFERLLTDIDASLATHGFKNILLIGDSGGNQSGMNAVAVRMNAQWTGRKTNFFFPEYYNRNSVDTWLDEQESTKPPKDSMTILRSPRRCCSLILTVCV